FGSRSSSTLNAWVTLHADKTREAYRSWKTGGEADTPGDPPKGNEGTDEDDMDEVGVAKEFARDRFVLLIEGGDRRLQDERMRKTALQALRAQSGVQSAAHMMLPVVVDADAQSLKAGQDGLVESVRGQLRILLELVDPPSRGLIETLLRQRRILLYIAC